MFLNILESPSENCELGPRLCWDDGSRTMLPSKFTFVSLALEWSVDV